MKKFISLFIFLVIVILFLGFQSMQKYKGRVINSIDHSGVKNVGIRIIPGNERTVTDSRGYFTLPIAIGIGDTIELSKPGYRTKRLVILSPHFRIYEISPKGPAHMPIVDYKDSGISTKSETEEDVRMEQMAVNNYRNATTIIPVPDYHEQPNTETYDPIHENSWQVPHKTAYSTFSIDVDGASYSNIRRFINRGIFPPRDAVRIEELINYFSYDYPNVIGKDDFSQYTETGICPWNKDHHLLQIGIKGKELLKDERPASSLVFLIDVSGSMRSNDKLPLIKEAFGLLVQQLSADDKVSIVTYAGNSSVLLEGVNGNDKHQILHTISGLNAGGSTAGSDGLQTAYRLASESLMDEGNNRVIIATDGDFNAGPSSDEEMIQLIEKKRELGIFLTVLGFGTGNYKDSKMQKLANHGNGHHACIDNIHEARKVFVDDLQSSLFVVAKDVKIQVEFNPAYVQAYRLIGYQNRLLNDSDFNNDRKDAGEIGAGHTVTALYEIVPHGADMSTIYNIDPLKYQDLEYKPISGILNGELANIKLRYKKPDADKSLKKEWVIPVKKEYNDSDLSHDFNWAASMAMFGMILRDAQYRGSSNYEKTLRLALQSKSVDHWGYRAEAINLIRSAHLLHSDHIGYRTRE
jgi:Ca-activated chloride channel family protein